MEKLEIIDHWLKFKSKKQQESFLIYFKLQGYPEDYEWWEPFALGGHDIFMVGTIVEEAINNYNKFMEEDVNISGHKGPRSCDSSISESVPSTETGNT